MDQKKRGLVLVRDLAYHNSCSHPIVERVYSYEYGVIHSTGNGGSWDDDATFEVEQAAMREYLRLASTAGELHEA